MSRTPTGRPGAVVAVLTVLVGLLMSACSASGGAGGGSAGTAGTSAGSLTLYTSVTQQTVDAVVGGYQKAHAGRRVTVFRAPTGQLNARIAADQRSGGLKADVIWGTDPLSMQSYTDQHLLAPWPLPALTSVPKKYRTDTFWGTRLLSLVIVAHKGLQPVPRSWADLTKKAYAGKVAIPDPAFAGSAFAALGYFSTAPGMGMEFFRDLRANGARQVASIPEVVTGVAQGRYQLGITLDSEARAAQQKGSPVTLVWPKPGAITFYSPIAMTTSGAPRAAAAAKDFIGYVLSVPGQQRIAQTGWQPVLAAVPGPPRPAGATSVFPDWSALFGHQQELLTQYRASFIG